MKAIVLTKFGSVDNFALAEVKKPANTENNVLVQIKATAFNPIDYQMRQGSSESKLLSSSILGRECAGIVTEIGQHVKDFSLGDEVLAYAGSMGSNGTYTEYISIPQELVARKAYNISFEEACAIPLVGLTALQCYERLNIKHNHTLFIAGGAGGVGTMLIKLLLCNGIDSFITTAGSTESKAHLLNLGVKEHAIIDYQRTGLTERLLAHNLNQPYDYVIDLVGGSLSEVCSEVVKINGLYADITNLATTKAREQLFDKGIIVLNISNYAYSLSRQSYYLKYYGEKLTSLVNMIEVRKLTPPPLHVVGDLTIDTVKTAHTLLETNQSKGKKLVMRIA